jgi:hypothetical protein
MFVKKLCLVALFSAVGILAIQPANLLVAHALAGTNAVAASPAKKKNKTRKSRKQMILKGRHVKHKSRPA